MKISNRKIDINHPPFLIAEMSGNHNGSLSNAIKIVKAAAKTGVNAIKLQTYEADSMTLNSDNKYFKITDSELIYKQSV